MLLDKQKFSKMSFADIESQAVPFSEFVNSQLSGKINSLLTKGDVF